MEAAGTPSGGEAPASVDGEGGEETSLTTTQSGIPIAPVYAGFARRRRCFHEGFDYCRG